jgi:hypothetical protein
MHTSFLRLALAPLSVACTLALAASPALSAPQNGAADHRTEDSVRAELRQAFLTGPTKDMFVAIRDVFPSEYQAFEDKLVQGVARGEIDQAQANRIGFEFTRDLSSKHIPELAHAAPEDLTRVASAQLDVMKTLERTHVAACYEFGEDGALSQARAAEIGPDAQEKLAVLITREFQGLKSARAAPRTYPALSDDDWKAIFTRYGDLGGDATWLQSQSDKAALGKLTPETRCHSSVALFEAATGGAQDLTAKFMAMVLSPDAAK